MTKVLTIAALLAGFSAVLAFKAWLLVLVLGWFGITALGFWKAVVAIILLDLILAAGASANKN